MSEVERFDAYYGYPSCRANGRHIHANGEFVLASDYDALVAELARVKAESLRVVEVGEPCKLSEMECLNVNDHTNTCTVENVDWRIYAAERRVDDMGHRYLMPVSDEWPPIPFGPDTIVQPVRLERWESINADA